VWGEALGDPARVDPMRLRAFQRRLWSVLPRVDAKRAEVLPSPDAHSCGAAGAVASESPRLAPPPSVSAASR
jgi:hypothetical protein